MLLECWCAKMTRITKFHSTLSSLIHPTLTTLQYQAETNLHGKHAPRGYKDMMYDTIIYVCTLL